MQKKQLILLLVMLFGIFFTVFTQEQHEKEDVQVEENISESIMEQNQTLEIHSIEDYLTFAKTVTSQYTYENWEVKLCSDLNFSNHEKLLSIGDLGSEIDPVTFQGIFDGNGHTITGLHIENPEGYAGMFANLGGTVKNLQLKNCSFIGEKSGSIAVNTEDASIYNCYIDAYVEGERKGTIVSRLSGEIVNCISPVGEIYDALRKGGVYNCYTRDEGVVELLNQNLMFVSKRFGDSALCYWECIDNDVRLTMQQAELLEKVSAHLNVSGTTLELEGYFSENQGKWCIALPAAYREKDIYVEVQTTDGQTLYLNKPSELQEIEVSLLNADYPILFLCADNIDTLYISLAIDGGLAYIHQNKYEEVPGIVTILESDGNVEHAVLEGFYGHGNDSWNEEKKSYNLKFDSYVNLLGMGANEDYALLAGYRRNSLMSYVTTNELVQEIGFSYAPEFRLVNVYVSGEYVGVYFLAEKIKLDRNRIDIPNIYEKTQQVNDKQLESYEYQKQQFENSYRQLHYYNVEMNPNDITGGYLLEVDNEDYGEFDSRFVTNRDIGIVLKRARYSSKEQVEYISEFWQDFENALYSEDGYNNKGKYYTEYIDLESFAMQWLMYELEQEISLNSSIYYYKESDIDGDGLIHACYPWDIEHSYVLSEFNEQLWHMGENYDALNGFWCAFYQHEDFRKEISKIWSEKFVPAIEKMLSEEPVETENGLRTLNWYRYYMIDMHTLENSRWVSQYPWDRIGTIEEFLKIRLEALTEVLKCFIEEPLNE